MNDRLGDLSTVFTRRHWGVDSPVRCLAISACFLAVISIASPLPTSADETSSETISAGRVPQIAVDPPTRVNAAPHPRSRGHLDGLYVWLGPVGAASHIDATWDSTFGGQLAFVRVRESQRLGAFGITAGASSWTERAGGRLWVDGLAGTRLGRMVGVTAGPLVELAALAHPRIGASVGVWAFLGVTPFARVGVVHELGPFAEIGLHIALPVSRSY